MTSPPGRERVCGFYGKIPAAGDFIGRGLPHEVTRRWDRWMELALRQAIETGGGGGAWRFRAAPGIFASGPVAGVFQLSRDRVGRRFPMLIAAAGASPATTSPWYDAAEALLVAACAGGTLEALSDGVLGLAPPGVEARSHGAAFWQGQAPGQVLSFATASALADGGLDRIFRAGGPPDLEAGGDGGDIDPLQLWQEAADTRIGPSPGSGKGLDETESLDLDELLGEATGPEMRAPEGSATPEPEGDGLGDPDPLGSAGGDPLDDLLSDSEEPERPEPVAESRSAESGRRDAPAGETDPLEDILAGGLDDATPVQQAESSIAPPAATQDIPADRPASGIDPLADFLDAEAAPLSGELPSVSAGDILGDSPGSAALAASLPEDFLEDAPGGPWTAAPVGLAEEQDRGDPIDALWGDDLPPPAELGDPVPGDPARAAPGKAILPEVAPLDAEERLDLDDLIDGLAEDGSKSDR